MKKFDIQVLLDEREKTLTVEEDSTPGSYRISESFKFISRIFRDTDGRWKSLEVTDLSPADINTIGEEIELYLQDQANR